MIQLVMISYTIYYNKICRNTLLLLLILATTSCAFLFDKKIKEVKPYQKPQAIDENFSYNGRFVITTESDTYYGTFSWIKSGTQQQLELRSVLGNTVAKIDITDQYNVLQVKDKIYRQDFPSKQSASTPISKILASAPLTKMMASAPVSTTEPQDDSHYGDLNKLLKDYLGFEIPLQYMHYWVQGVPLPQYHIDQQLTDGFMQQSWKVEYLQYKNGKPTITKITRDKLMIKLLLI